MTDCHYGRPLQDQNLEYAAQSFNSTFAKAFNDNNYSAGAVETKHAAEHFIDQTLKLSRDDQYNVFKRAQELNDEAFCNSGSFPRINIVFNDAQKDGKREDLAEFNIINKSTAGNSAISIEQRLYHP